jgi:site-specific recombinase XerD
MAGKRGRPPKKTATREKNIGFYMTWAQYAVIERRAEAAGVNISDYMRQVAIQGEVRARNKVIVGLLVNQGLRVEELKALKVQDLRLREGRITVHHQRRTAKRVLELEAGQVYELLDYLADTRKQLLRLQGGSTDALFLQHHDVDNFYGVTSVILEHLRRINHKVKNLDQVRASVITHWVQVYDLRKAQYLAGHRHVSSTEQYKQQVLDELQADVKKFHPF